MNNKERLNMIHSAPLMVTGIMALIYNTIALANIEISSLVKLIIVSFGIVAVTICVISFIMKLKKLISKIKKSKIKRGKIIRKYL